MDCLACGITASRESREHVFSRWLLERFGSLNLVMGLARHLSNGTNPSVRREYRLDSFKLKKICESCNNGWMSKLESDAKPLILGLISKELAIEALSDDERCLLARWAGKTAIIESHAVGAECPIDARFFRQIKRDIYHHPGTFAVAVCKTEYAGFGHVQVGVIHDLIGGGKAAGNLITIALPHLAFVCAFPMLEIRYECQLTLPLQGLWPTDQRCWHPLHGNFPELHLINSESLLSLTERVGLYHGVQCS